MHSQARIQDYVGGAKLDVLGWIVQENCASIKEGVHLPP